MALLVVILTGLLILIAILWPRTASESTLMVETTNLSDTYVTAVISPLTPTYRSPQYSLSENSIVRERQNYVIHQCQEFGADPLLCLAIIPCEGGFFNPENCNKTYGCPGGMGPWQFIESTWFSTQKRMGDLLPEKCRQGDMRGDFECNARAGAWLLSVDGVGHWIQWSGHCFWPRYYQAKNQ